MGITFAKLFQRLFSKKEMRILMVRLRELLFFLYVWLECGVSRRKDGTRSFFRGDYSRRQIEQTGILDDDDEGADWILNCAPRE